MTFIKYFPAIDANIPPTDANIQPLTVVIFIKPSLLSFSSNTFHFLRTHQDPISDLRLQSPTFTFHPPFKNWPTQSSEVTFNLPSSSSIFQLTSNLRTRCFYHHHQSSSRPPIANLNQAWSPEPIPFWDQPALSLPNPANLKLHRSISLRHRSHPNPNRPPNSHSSIPKQAANFLIPNKSPLF